MSILDINKRICFMPSDGGTAGVGGGDDGGDSGNDGGYDNESEAGYDAGKASDVQAKENESTNTNDFSDGNGEYGDYNNFDGRTLGTDTPLGQEESDIDAQNAGFDGFSLDQQAADMGFADTSVSVNTVNSTTGLIAYNINFLGLTLDGHAFGNVNSISAKDLSIAEELAADALELFGIEVTVNNVDAMESAIGLIVAIATGTTGVALGIQVAETAVKTAKATGAISEETADVLEFSIAVVSFTYSAYNTLEATSALMSYSSYMTTTAKLASVAVAAYSVYGIVKEIKELDAYATSLGLNASEVSEADLSQFDQENSRGEIGEKGGSVIEAMKEVLRWKLANGDATYNAIDASDIFDKMAGGFLYNEFMGGGMYFTATGVQVQQEASVGRDTDLSDESRYVLTGSDYWFDKNIDIAKSRVEDTDDIDIIDLVAIKEYNEMITMNNAIAEEVDAYNEKVDEWNQHTDGYDYDAASDWLDTQGQTISTMQSDFDSLYA